MLPMSMTERKKVFDLMTWVLKMQKRHKGKLLGVQYEQLHMKVVDVWRMGEDKVPLWELTPSKERDQMWDYLND